ncbi:hypothetical protein [Enterobacter roggenkampii]|uniref:hypothetical protein n=1 Tax=Enterobacter roggenkampii TaxID=1812935 RepID=UPI001F286B47|nr:hypothetical protein [Enterobacter roggenkampii]
MLNKKELDDMTGVLMQCIFANTPAVSPESKNPAQAGFSLCSNCSLFVAAVAAQLCQA